MSLAAIFAFLKAIPQILDLIARAEKALGPDWAAIAGETMDSYAKVRNAKTPEERDDALKRISHAWTH